MPQGFKCFEEDEKIRTLENQFSRGREFGWPKERLQDILKQLSVLRRALARRKNWFENWVGKTGPLFGVPKPKGKKEGGRV